MGDIAGALRLITSDVMKESPDVFAAAYARHCRARLDELAGRIDEALAAYEDAERRYAQTDFRRMSWNALVHLDHAALLASVGRGAEAAEHLAAAEAILPAQRGERAERIAALRQMIAKVGAAS
jgi:hypothetical protein